jgi:hypothetical protein
VRRPDAEYAVASAAMVSRKAISLEARLQRIESELTAEGISAALTDRKHFPEVDDLVAPEPEEGTD